MTLRHDPSCSERVTRWTLSAERWVFKPLVDCVARRADVSCYLVRLTKAERAGGVNAKALYTS